jgi:flagellar hook-associated protein FlgK
MVDETNQPYAYAGDDPVNGVDPMGLRPVAVAGLRTLSESESVSPCETTLALDDVSIGIFDEEMAKLFLSQSFNDLQLERDYEDAYGGECTLHNPSSSCTTISSKIATYGAGALAGFENALQFSVNATSLYQSAMNISESGPAWFDSYVQMQASIGTEAFGENAITAFQTGFTFAQDLVSGVNSLNQFFGDTIGDLGSEAEQAAVDANSIAINVISDTGP